MNAIIGFKKFITNKNTVTLIGVILGIVILYYSYQWRVNEAIEPITLPYAAVSIQPRTQITEDMIGYVSIPKSMLKSTVITSTSNIIGKYVNINSMIPENSLFYSGAVVNQSELPNAYTYDVPENYKTFVLSLTDSALGYGILPDTYINIWVKLENDAGEPMVGELIQNVKLSVVLDKSYNAVYDNLDEDRVPSYFLFALPMDMYTLLKKAQYLTTYKVEIFPVANLVTYEDDSDAIRVSSSQLQAFIESKTVDVVIDEIETTVPDVDFPSIGN